jgi:hypothetical protein
MRAQNFSQNLSGRRIFVMIVHMVLIGMQYKLLSILNFLQTMVMPMLNLQLLFVINVEKALEKIW